MKVVRTIERFINHEAAGGVLLMSTALLALILSNSPLAWAYDAALQAPFVIQIGALELKKTVLLFINDGLMAVFFFLVGLEIKREVMRGRLSTFDQAILPGLAAVGGMVVPALVYIAVIGGDPLLMNGWAIPAATDIAFALGVLALLGARAPLALKIFLLALAIIDDLGAIAIIAVFYTAKLSLLSLTGGLIVLAILVAMNLRGLKTIAPYILLGVVMWVFVLKSGVHATLAGVALAMTIPITGEKDHSPLEKLEHALHPYVAYLVMPVFAFANAGVSLSGLGLDALLQPLTLAIALGLLIGKPIGVVGAVWLALKSGIARLPEGVSMIQMVGVSALAGIGFTMSLFIGTLAFDDPAYAAGVRLGVLGGSILSALLGYFILAAPSVREDVPKADAAGADSERAQT